MEKKQAQLCEWSGEEVRSDSGGWVECPGCGYLHLDKAAGGSLLTLPDHEPLLDTEF